MREAKVRAAKAAATAETAEAKKQRRAESRRRAASEANAARFQARRRRGIRRLREKLRRKGALSATKEAELAALERELTEVSRADVGVEDGRAVFSVAAIERTAKWSPAPAEHSTAVFHPDVGARDLCQLALQGGELGFLRR